MTHPPAPWRRQPLLIAALLALASCGGGDSTGNDTAAPVAYYSTMTYRDSRTLALAVFEEGPVYRFYQSDYNVPERPEYVYAGFFVGQPGARTAPRSLYKGYEFDFDRKAVVPVEVTLESPSHESVSGTIARGNGADDAFTATYASSAVKPTDTSMLPGRYASKLRSVTEEGVLQASVDAAGNLSAALPNGCTATVTLEARPLGNSYSAEATLGPACPTLAGRYSGWAMQSWANSNIYVMLTSEGFERGVFLHLFDRTR